MLVIWFYKMRLINHWVVIIMVLNLEFHNGKYEDIAQRQRDIWLGVSVSLKPYDPELARQYVDFIASYSKDNAVILIADDIAKYNYRHLDKAGWDAAKRRAKKDGDRMGSFYQEIVSMLPEHKQEAVDIIRWQDITTDRLERQISLLREEYMDSPELREEVHKPIVHYLQKKGRTITPERLEGLSDYVISELPSLCDGVVYDGRRYSVMLYPTYSGGSLDSLVCGIQKGTKFPELKEKLGISGDHILIDAFIP